MYERHRHHLRGDKVAGTGFGYECLWRSLLMLRLGPSDTLTIYQGEDACITKIDEQKIYYQIKYTSRSWTPSKLSDFLERANWELADHPNISYVFCTNVPLTSETERAFDEIKQRWDDRLTQEQWAPDPEDPADKIRNRIRRVLENHFQPRRISDVLTFDRIDNCCNNLLALEAQFKLAEKTSISGDQVWEKTGLKQLIEEIPSLISGGRLFTWLSWIEKARTQDTDTILSATRSIALDPDGIGLDLEEEVFQFANQWGRNPSESHLYLISGASGTGKTWLLLRLGMRLSQQFPVYWADEVATGRDPELAALSSWEDRPTVVLIDNLIEAEWSRLVAEALRLQPPVLIIGTTSKPLHDKQVSSLQQRAGQKFISCELGPLLREEEVDKILKKFRRGVVARAEQKALRSTNIRYAIRLLKGQESQIGLANRVYNLWRRDECQAWVMPLILCSSLGVKVPRSLLRENAHLDSRGALELPEDLWPVTLRMKRDEDEVLWLEDSDVARDVLEKIKSEVTMTTSEESLLEKAVQLVRNVRVESALHRQFARRIVREFCETYPHHQARLLEECKDNILQLLPHETRWALAYVWLPFLPQAERTIEARKAAQEFLSRSPESVADVILLIEAFGDEHASKIISQEFQGARQWGTEPWATFIEHLRPLDSQSKRDLLELAIPILKIAPLNVSRLLDTRDIAVDLLTLIEDFGQPDHREWFLGELHKVLPESPTEEALKRHHLIPPYFKLVSRCIMQPRNGLAMVVAHKLLAGYLQNTMALQQLYVEIYDGYRAAYDNEIGKAYHEMALRRGRNYALAEAKPTKANTLWGCLLPFAGQWASAAVREQIEDEVYKFLQRMLENKLPLHLVENTALALGHDLVAKGGVSPDKIKVLLELLRQGSMTQEALHMLLHLTGAVGGCQYPTESSLAKQARAVLRVIACMGGNKASKLATSFFRDLGTWAGIKDHQTLELPPISEPNRFQVSIVISLLYCIRNVPWDKVEGQELSNAVYNYWHGNTAVRWDLFLTLVRLNGVQQAKAIVEKLRETAPDKPDTLLFSSTWEARFGDPQLAQDSLVKALRIYLIKKEGGHPQQVSRAYVDLARCCERPKREIFELCAALTGLGPLRPLNEVLKLV